MSTGTEDLPDELLAAAHPQAGHAVGGPGPRRPTGPPADQAGMDADGPEGTRLAKLPTVAGTHAPEGGGEGPRKGVRQSHPPGTDDIRQADALGAHGQLAGSEEAL